MQRGANARLHELSLVNHYKTFNHSPSEAQSPEMVNSNITTTFQLEIQPPGKRPRFRGAWSPHIHHLICPQKDLLSASTLLSHFTEEDTKPEREDSQSTAHGHTELNLTKRKRQHRRGRGAPAAKPELCPQRVV